MNQIDTATDETDSTDRTIPTSSIGEGTLTIDVDAETYHQLHEEFLHQAEHGYSEDFLTFALNFLELDEHLTVDGDPVDPEFDSE